MGQQVSVFQPMGLDEGITTSRIGKQLSHFRAAGVSSCPGSKVCSPGGFVPAMCWSGL